MHDIIILSGGFDPLHIGHVRMIRAAGEMANHVLIGLNSDAWLERKKGYVFMPWEERKEILVAMRDVSFVWDFEDDDIGSACGIIRKAVENLRPTSIAFGNGGDRRAEDEMDAQLRKETGVCQELGVDMLWGLGGGKIQSSSALAQRQQR